MVRDLLPTHIFLFLLQLLNKGLAALERRATVVGFFVRFLVLSLEFLKTWVPLEMLRFPTVS